MEIKNIILPFSVLVIFLLVWSVAASLYDMVFLLPGPMKVVEAFIEDFHIILGGAKHTVFFKDADGNEFSGHQKSKYGTDRVVIKDFKYLTLKEPGKSMTTDAGLRDQAMQWIVNNVPKTLKNKGIFQSDVPIKEESENLLPEVYCDLDQVLVNFLEGAEKVLGKAYTDQKYWNKPESGDKKTELTKKN